VLVVLDRSTPLQDDDRALLARRFDVPRIVVRNKQDLEDQLGPVASLAAPVVEISARDGRGIDVLRDKILGLLVSGGIPSRNTVLLLDTWERDLLRRTRDGLDRAAVAIESGSSPDIVAEELRAALNATGELQGIDISESILTHIFSRFCVGK